MTKKTPSIKIVVCSLNYRVNNSHSSVRQLIHTLSLSCVFQVEFDHDTGVMCVCSFEKILASGTEAGQVHVWDMKTHTPLYTIDGRRGRDDYRIQLYLLSTIYG